MRWSYRVKQPDKNLPRYIKRNALKKAIKELKLSIRK